MAANSGEIKKRLDLSFFGTCPKGKTVSKAGEDFPEPDTPVTTVR